MFRWLRVGVLAGALLSCLPAPRAEGATISLIAYTTFAIVLDDLSTALPNNSIIEIIGSTDAAQGGHLPYGGGFVWGSTQGDDILLATTVVDGSFGGGTFFHTTTYDDTVVLNYYIRFYDVTSVPTNGQAVAWGTSAVFAASSFFGVDFQDFAGGNIAFTNNFYVIPEPGSLSLLLYFGLLVGLFRSKWIRAWWRQAAQSG